MAGREQISPVLFNGYQREESTDRREAIPREYIPGIGLTNRNDRRHLDFAVNVSRHGNIFVVAASVPDITPFVAKNDPRDISIKAEGHRSSSEEGFVPEAVFTKGPGNPAMSIEFTLIPHDDGNLEIIDPKIRRTELELKGMIPVDKNNAAELVRNPRSKSFANAVALAPYLTERYDDIDEEVLFSPSELLKGLRRNMIKVTEEALTQYCLDRDLPVIFNEFNIDPSKEKYTLFPDDDAKATVPIANIQTNPIAIANERVLLASLLNDLADDQETKFPYTDDELSDIARINTLLKPQRTARRRQTSLADMPQDQFRQLIVDIFIRGVDADTNSAENELSNRMLEGSAHVNDVYDVLFNFPDEDDSYDTLREEAIIALYAFPEYANAIFQLKSLKDKWQVKALQSSYVKNEKEQHDTTTVIDEGGKQIISDAFRTEDKERGISLTNASIIAKVSGITPETNRELFEDADLEDTVILLDDTAKESLLAEHAEELKSSQQKLREHCETNGFVLLPQEDAFYPDQGKTPYYTRLSVRIDDIIIARDHFTDNSQGAERNAARKLLGQLTNPIVIHEEVPDDFETQIPAFANELELDDTQFIIRTTTNSQGQVLTHCITSIGDNDIFTVIGTGEDENTASKIAKEKLYTVLQRENSRRKR